MPADESHPLADLPVTIRIDLTLAVLSAMEVQEYGGWTLADLADLCGCTEAAICHRQRHALAQARIKAESLGIKPRTLKPKSPQP